MPETESEPDDSDVAQCDNCGRETETVDGSGHCVVCRSAASEGRIDLEES